MHEVDMLDFEVGKSVVLSVCSPQLIVTKKNVGPLFLCFRQSSAFHFGNGLMGIFENYPNKTPSFSLTVTVSKVRSSHASQLS